MITVSLCMIVKNEEDTLKRCLDSVAGIADEIIVVDTGSTDATKEVALKYTDKVHSFEWCDDFSAARNFSFWQATMDYILWLDADDIILPEDAAKFKMLKETMAPDADTVMMKYNTGFDEQGNVSFSYFRERLSRRNGKFKWREPVHEYLEVAGKRIYSDVCITHAKPHGRQGGRNIQIYENLAAAGKEFSPRGMYYYARELMDHKRYAEAIDWFKRFLDSRMGWMEDNITACRELSKCCLLENRRGEALGFLFQSFSYDTPRIETCCQIGYYFKNLSDFKQAAFWFGLALELEDPKDSIGFRNEDYYGYIPCIELAVSYDKLGEYEKAAGFNEMALKHKPASPSALYNKEYFDEKLKGKSGNSESEA